MIATLLLAAGGSTRMGDADKLMQQIDGMPILACLAQRALNVGPVYVVLRENDDERRSVLPKSVHYVTAKDAHLGMAHSLQAGIAALPDACTGVMILPADMPDITAQDLASIKAHAVASKARIVRGATVDGKHGHPIYFAASEFPRFATLNGDRGAFKLCRGMEDEIEIVPLNGQRARLDLDTPEDWDSYRESLTT